MILFCTFHLAKAQKKEKVYYFRGHNYSTVYSYFVTELILYSDSTFVENDYKVSSKKEWKNFRKTEPLKREGQISKSDGRYLLTEVRDGNKSDIVNYVKIKNKKLVFYLKADDGTFEKVYTMKKKL